MDRYGQLLKKADQTMGKALEEKQTWFTYNNLIHWPVTERGAYYTFNSLGSNLLIFVES